MGSVYPTLQSRTHTVRIRGVHRRVIVVIIEHTGSSTPARSGVLREEARRQRLGIERLPLRVEGTTQRD